MSAAEHPEAAGYAAAEAALTAALARARAEGEAAGRAAERAAVWRHIADAPRDGSQILLFFPETQIHEALVAEGFFDPLFDKVWMLSRGSAALDGRTPTHWAPLPEPPATGGAR